MVALSNIFLSAKELIKIQKKVKFLFKFLKTISAQHVNNLGDSH